MQIKGKTKCDVTGLRIAANESNDGQSASLDLAVGIDPTTAVDLFGANMHTLAFSTTSFRESEQKDGKDLSHLVDSIKPSKRIKFGIHKVVVDDEINFRGQPLIRKVDLEDGVERATVHLRLDVHLGDNRMLMASLCAMVGEVVEAEFELEQPELPVEAQPTAGQFGAPAEAAH